MVPEGTQTSRESMNKPNTYTIVRKTTSRVIELNNKILKTKMITAENPSFILTNQCSAFTLITVKLTLYIVYELDGARLQVSHRIRSVFAVNLGSPAQ